MLSSDVRYWMEKHKDEYDDPGGLALGASIEGRLFPLSAPTPPDWAVEIAEEIKSHYRYLPQHTEHEFRPDSDVAHDLACCGGFVPTLCSTCKHLGDVEDNGVTYGGITEFTWQGCWHRAVGGRDNGFEVWASHGCLSFRWAEIHDCQLYEERAEPMVLSGAQEEE